MHLHRFLLTDFLSFWFSYTVFRKKAKKTRKAGFLPDFEVEMKGKDGLEESNRSLVPQSAAKIQHV